MLQLRQNDSLVSTTSIHQHHLALINSSALDVVSRCIMVRKKRKAVVPDANASVRSDATTTTSGPIASSQPVRVALQAIVAHVPLDAPLAIALTIAEVPVKPAGAAPTLVVATLQEWYALLCDASSLYDQLKLLQLFRAKCAKALLANDADSTTTSAFVVATWKLMFRLYVAPQTEALRKNFFLVLDVLAQSDALPRAGAAALETPLQRAAGDELRRFLDGVWASQAALASADARVQALDLLLLVTEFPFLARVLVNDPTPAPWLSSTTPVYLLQFVAFCADQLAALAAPIADYSIAADASSSSSQASTNVVLVASERCGHALKNAIALCTMRDVLYARVTQLIAATQADDEDATAAFVRILGHCVLILQTSVAHKDLLTQAGLAYCLVLRLLLQAPPSSSAWTPQDVTALLLYATYPETRAMDNALVQRVPSALVRIHMDADVASFGAFSRLAVYRGLLNSLADDELASASATSASVLDQLFTTVQDFCQDDALNTRLYAFQVLEAFLRRAVAITQRDAMAQTLLAPATLQTLTALLLRNWEHPSKRVNQFMAQMFVHVVRYFAQQPAEQFADWKRAIAAKLVAFPAHSRGKYGALTLLLAEHRADELLADHPTLLASVLLAVGHEYVSAAAAGLFAQLLDDLLVASGASDSSSKKKSKAKAVPESDSAAIDAWRLRWIDSVVDVLVSPDATLRARVAMYVLPLLLKKDAACVPVLVETLRAVAAASNATESTADTCLWAIIEVLKLARKRVSPDALVGLATAREIEIGLGHARGETRSAAFDAICASLKSTTMPTAAEVALVQTYLVVHGKEIASTARMNTMIGLKHVLLRVKESVRVRTKASSGDKDNDDDVQRAEVFLHWLERFVIASVYSGAIPQRQILGLDVLLLYIQVFGWPQDGAASLLRTPHMVTTLLNMLVSSWDVIRSLAYRILDLYPAELPGFTSKTSLSLLLKWAMALCVSARQRESDAGGLFMRLLFKKSAAIAEYGITFQAEAVENVESVENAAAHAPEIAFVLQLTDVILTRLGHASASEQLRNGELPLVHGLLLSLRYIVENVDFDAIQRNDVDGKSVHAWRVAMDRVFACIRKAMHFALFVVGDATSGVGDEELSDAFSSAVVVGEVNSLPKTDAIPLRVDCRGHLILEDGAVGGDADGENDTEQRAVVGSWLAARECGAILDVLMRRVPLPRASESTEAPAFFSTEMATQGGEMLLHSLFELKHKGAVATAYQAFEGVCRSFLAAGETNRVLGSLPQVWADRLLERLERSEQHFILRRSSGFAFSFVAILRAEPRNSAAVILPKVMANLLRLAGMDTDALAATATQQAQHLLWRSRVHALNILKLICQDAILADDVAVYVAQMLELAVFGFDCSSWAVRNSAMMLFAAATQRAIGDKRIADGASHVKVSSADVFSRFPQLHSFLLRELTKCTQAFSTFSTPPPGLYPILMFMSRLKPGDAADAAESATAEATTLATFVPLVLACAAQSTMAIRQMAAKVLATITSDDDAVALLATLTAQLPRGVRSSTTTASTAPRMTTNFVHGVLLQLLHVVAKYLTPVSSLDAHQNQIAAQMREHLATELFASKLWLWTSATLASGVLRAVFLEIVDAFVQSSCSAAGAPSDAVARALDVIQTHVEADLSRLSASNEDALSATTSPGSYVADRARVSIYFRLWLRNERNELPPLVTAMLASRVLEVRKRTVQQLTHAVHSSALTLSSDALATLRTVLATQVLVETHPKCHARQLALLVHCATLSSNATESLLSESLCAATQTALLSTLAQSADADVLAPTLELLALLVRQSAYADAGVCQTLAQEIVARSSAQQTLVLRHAAARALRFSGFLLLAPASDEESSAWTTQVAVDCWLSALTLLQDDEVSTRALVRTGVQDALAASESLSQTQKLPVSASDTLVLPVAVAHIVAQFSATAYGASTLAATVLSAMDAAHVLKTYTSAARSREDWGDLCDRIFEAESSNYFAEPDLVAQLWIYHVLVADLAPQTHDALVTLRADVLARVSDVLALLEREDTREQWIGGITYYSSVFASLLSLLAAGVAIVCGPQRDAVNKKTRSAIVSRAKACAARFETLHPLVQRALELLSGADASVDRNSNKGVVTELLALTPYWQALEM